jgi:hypothetical protein
VFEAISQMERNKAPEPDEFPLEFYQTFWEAIKNKLMAIFKLLHQNKPSLFKLNFGAITLLTKKENAVQI